MFKNLKIYDYQRTAKEAIGFYIAYNLLVILVAVGFNWFLILALAVIFKISINKAAFGNLMLLSQYGFIIGRIVATICCVWISFKIAKKKHLTQESHVRLVVFGSVLLPLIGGTLLGMVPASYLSTIPSKSRNSDFKKNLAESNC